MNNLRLNLIRNLFLGNYAVKIVQPKVYLNHVRYLNYKTPVNRPKVFTPTTLPVTNANKHLKVNLLDEKDKDLGEMRLESAKELADSRNLKLVIIEESSTPPKFKIMSGHDLYQLQMKYRDSYKDNVKEPKLKEIDVNLGIDDHDLDIKLKMLRNFYEKGCTVKFKVLSKIINKKVSIDFYSLIIICTLFKNFFSQDKNIPKLQEDFIKKLKTIVTFGKLDIEKQTENIIIFSLSPEKNVK